MTVQLGIIGGGGIAMLHAEAAAKVGIPLAGVCDTRQERAQALAAKYPGAQATTSLDELLAMPELGAVVVATPNMFHKDMAIAALRAGKDVLLEKPMAMNAAQCDEIIQTMRLTGRLVQLGFVCRCAPASQAAHDLVAAGSLGRVYHARANLCRRRGIPGLGKWFTTKSQSGGGVLMDLGVHLLDLVLHITGYPKAMRAGAVCTSTFGSPIDRYTYTEMWSGPPNRHGRFDVEDAAMALIRFDTGLTMELNVTWAANVPEGVLSDGIVLLGEEGGCYFDLWRNELIVTTERDGELVDERPPLPQCDPWEAAWQRQYELFSHALSHRSVPHASAQDGRIVQALIDVLYRSAEQGHELEID